MPVRPKKSLGQHFLTDKNIAQKIVNALRATSGNVLEIGPGTGILTQFLLEDPRLNCRFIDTDREAHEYLTEKFNEHKEKFISADFLKEDTAGLFNDSYSVIGNLPYNISSQIFFSILEHRQKAEEVVAMIQREVADRIASPPGSKQYGILSVLLQAFYDIEFLFGVKPGVFDPPPKVNSAVIRLERNNTKKLDCNEELFFKIVKASFNYRRKTLRNTMKPFVKDAAVLQEDIFNKRPEQLGVEEFVYLTRLVESYQFKV